MKFKNVAFFKGLKSFKFSKSKRSSTPPLSPDPIDIPTEKEKLRESLAESQSTPPLLGEDTEANPVVADTYLQFLHVELVQDHWMSDLPKEWGFELPLDSSASEPSNKFAYDLSDPVEAQDDTRDAGDTLPLPYSHTLDTIPEENDDELEGQTILSPSLFKRGKGGFFNRDQPAGTMKVRLRSFFKKRATKEPRVRMKGMKRWIVKHFRHTIQSPSQSKELEAFRFPQNYEQRPSTPLMPPPAQHVDLNESGSSIHSLPGSPVPIDLTSFSTTIEDISLLDKQVGYSPVLSLFSASPSDLSGLRQSLLHRIEKMASSSLQRLAGTTPLSTPSKSKLDLVSRISVYSLVPSDHSAVVSQIENAMADCEETSLILVPFEANILLELPFFDEASLVSSTPQRTAPTTPSLLRYSPASTHSRKASNEMLSNLVDVFSLSSRSSSLSSSPPKLELVPTTSSRVSKPSPRIPDWVVPRPPERHISWHLKFKAKSPPPTPPGPIAPTCAPSSPVQVVERAVRPKHSPPRPIPIPTRVDIQKDFDKFDANDIENGVDEEDDVDEQSPLAATLTRMNDLYGFFSHLVKDSKR